MKKDARVKVIHKSNKEVSKDRNKGLSFANEDYIMFLDSDDWLEQDAVEKLINISNKNYCF